MALAGALQFDRLGSLSRGRPFCSPRHGQISAPTTSNELREHRTVDHRAVALSLWEVQHQTWKLGHLY